MKLRLSPMASDILICLYAAITLYFRFKFENDTTISAANSIILGACFVVLIWALIKLKVLNPRGFGLFNSKK